MLSQSKRVLSFWSLGPTILDSRDTIFTHIAFTHSKHRIMLYPYHTHLHTQTDKETTPPIADTASSTSEAQVKSSTFIAVVVVVVVVALIGYTVTMAAVVIYYRNKLRAQVHVSEELQQQSGAEHDTSIAPIAPVAPV